MSYHQTLEYLYTQLPVFQRVGPVAFKKNLGNINALCQALGNPHQQFPSIHLAGTNGKGTTSHLLSAVMQAHGFKTGMYTSPHYRDFRERIKLNGALISRAAVVRFVDQHQALFQKIRPSFFEITVALAFHHFAKSQVDIAIIETGLGGRLDSTNIIKPLLSIITNISFDHQQMLGDTLPQIAREKAGIIKAGIPVVIGEEQEESKVVFLEKAQDLKVPIHFASRHYRVELVSEKSISHSTYCVWKDGRKYLEDLEVNLHGPFQAKNLITLFQSLDILETNGHLLLKEDRLRYALANIRHLTRYIGRWQILASQPLTITDSAHNEAGLSLVMQAIRNLPHQNLHFVLGMVKDKSIEKALALLPKTAHYYFARPAIPRGLDATVLKEKAAQYGLKGRSYSSVKNAWRAAKRKAEAEDVIYIGGSTFVVAEVV